MGYEIKQTDDGFFQVLEMWPVEIARFGSETHARMFVRRVLEADAPGADAATAEAAPEVRKTPEERAGLPPLGGFTGELMRQADCGAGAFEDDPWEAALARVAAGERCKAVAEDMGLSFPSLRARWAGRKSREKAEAGEQAAPEAVEAAPAPPRVNLTVTADPSVVPFVTALSLPDAVEDVRGRPDLVARKADPWTDEIDLAIIEAGEDEAALWRVAAETGVSLERVRRRQDVLLEGIAKEIGR